MASDARWQLEELHYVATGRLSRPMHDYPPLAVVALLNWARTAVRDEVERAKRDALFADRAEQEALGRTRTVGGARLGPPGPRRPLTGGGYDTARVTGDRVADAWEKAIARGETPDLELR